VAVATEFTKVWEDAYKDSVTQPAATKASYLLETIGPRIAAAALSLADARQIKLWGTEDIEPRERDVAVRLDALYWVVRAVVGCYSPAVAARFLRSSNPQLDDEAPLVVLAGAKDPEAIRRVLTSARAFLEG
jgi:hypothetical protein